MKNIFSKEIVSLISDIPNIYLEHDKTLKYHNSKHILDFIDKLINTEYINKIHEEDIYFFLLAVVYHDSVYNVFSVNNNNEGRSADLFCNSKHFYKLLESVGEDYDLVKGYIDGLILSTKFGAEHNTIDKKVMHDIDYSGFANPCRFRYLQTQFNVIDEFLIPWDRNLIDIIPKRIEFLSNINKTKIYYFDDVFSEEVAHDNINFEIDFWNNYKG